MRPIQSVSWYPAHPSIGFNLGGTDGIHTCIFISLRALLPRPLQSCLLHLKKKLQRTGEEEDEDEEGEKEEKGEKEKNKYRQSSPVGPYQIPLPSPMLMLMRKEKKKDWCPIFPGPLLLLTAAIVVYIYIYAVYMPQG